MLYLKCYSLTQACWLKDKAPIPREFLDYQRYNVIVVFPGRLPHMGHYQCKGTREDGRRFTAEAEVIFVGMSLFAKESEQSLGVVI